MKRYLVFLCIVILLIGCSSTFDNEEAKYVNDIKEIHPILPCIESNSEDHGFFSVKNTYYYDMPSSDPMIYYHIAMTRIKQYDDSIDYSIEFVYYSFTGNEEYSQLTKIDLGNIGILDCRDCKTEKQKLNNETLYTYMLIYDVPKELYDSIITQTTINVSIGDEKFVLPNSFVQQLIINNSL
jgi:hypothetical protein